MDSNHTGETTISLDGRDLTLVYDWRALSALRALLDGGDVFQALTKQDPDMLASIVAIGLARHHPDMRADTVLTASPPLLPTLATTVTALNRAYWGAEVRPPPDPPLPAGKARPAGAGSPRR